jgi:hypothetical protein
LGSRRPVPAFLWKRRCASNDVRAVVSFPRSCRGVISAL